ncbi:MAG: hypothetical protein LBG84_07330 [Treponema sp.]|jgi:hypothetical protein|nr:hypothetical protein [Treponema sp.]
MGHRDGTPEDPDEFHAWAENYVNVMTENHEKWGIPLDQIEIPRQYFALLEEEMREEDARPVEPNPFDGYTIYWNGKKRFVEMLCEFLKVPWEDGPGNGVFDQREIAKAMLSEGYSLQGWKDYLVSVAEKTEKKYGMPSGWAGKMKKKLEDLPAPAPAGGGQEQQLLFILQHV